MLAARHLADATRDGTDRSNLAVRLLTVTLLALAAILCAPVGAGASTIAVEKVEFCVDGPGDCRYMVYQAGVVLRYAGESAERNRLLVRREGDVLVVTDAGAALRPGSGCVTSDAQTARCALTVPLVGYRLAGGDGDDVIAVVGALGLAAAVGQPRLLLGGAGTDELSDGADASALLGGPGADRLSGGLGADRFFDTDDPARSDERDDAAADVVDGGAGADTVDYRSRRRDLDLSLAGTSPGGGERGEHDRLHRVEVVLAGHGDDHVVGGPQADRLVGGDGADRLRGGDGDDEVLGGGGGDDLLGGRGDDRVGPGSSPAGVADRAGCGPGRDVAGEHVSDSFLGDTWPGPDAIDIVGSDCEGVPFSSEDDEGREVRLDARPRRRGRTWTFANACAQAGDRPCRGRLDLALPGARAFARTHFATTGRVRVRVGRVNARRLARARRVSIRVATRQRAAFGARREAAFTLSLAPAR